jgi:hypothetical protein
MHAGRCNTRRVRRTGLSPLSIVNVRGTALAALEDYYPGAYPGAYPYKFAIPAAEHV